MKFIDFVHEDDRNRLTEIWTRGESSHDAYAPVGSIDMLVAFQVYCDREIASSGHYRFRTGDKGYITLETKFEPFVNPWNDQLEIVVARNKIK